MEVYINDIQKIVHQETNLKELLDNLDICKSSHCAVAVNNQIISQKDWKDQILENEDNITIIHPAQGG